MNNFHRLLMVTGFFWISSLAFADEATVNLDQICGESSAESGSVGLSQATEERPSFKLVSLSEQDTFFVDQGFCSVYAGSKAASMPLGSWKIRLYASHSFTRYFNSDINFQSSRYSVEIKDYEWAERGSREFFTPKEWAKPGSNPAQMLDEPTNTFTISIEKEGHEFYLSAFHPKFHQAPGQIKAMSGVIDGIQVDQTQAVNEPFHGYNFRPGESKLARNQFTHMQMLYEAGYGHRFTVFRTRIGNLTYIPHVGVGFMMGQNYSVMVQAGAWWDFEDATAPFGFNGYGASAGNRIEINTPNERVGIFYENRLGYYKMQSRFLDGTQKFNLGFVGNSVGVKFLLHHPKKQAPRALLNF